MVHLAVDLFLACFDWVREHGGSGVIMDQEIVVKVDESIVMLIEAIMCAIAGVFLNRSENQIIIIKHNSDAVGGSAGLVV